MSHVPHGELVLYAFQPEAVPDSRRAEIEAHLATCAQCQQMHDFFAIPDDDLVKAHGEPDTWEPSIATATYTSLMEYGARVAEEDREAEVLLKDFLANPIETAWTALERTRRYRTGGVVRKLTAAAHGICESEPLVALTFAEAAVAVAETLPDNLYPAGGVHQLRGTAWKECANAQMLLGQFPQALESLEHAEDAYKRNPNDALGIAIVALVRAGVLASQERLDEAIVMAERAEHGFAHAGDENRRMDAAFVRGNILFDTGNVNGALSVYHRIIKHGENMRSPRWIARGTYMAGHCEVERRNLEEASLQFHRALKIFREIGPESERLVTEWGIARVVLQGGKLNEAIRRLRDVAAQFEKLGMVAYAAGVGLDIAEGLLALNRPKDIVALAQHLFSVYMDAGVLTGALSAIAYLKEAAAANRLTKREIHAVRFFLRRAERQPFLQFVPPEEPV